MAGDVPVWPDNMALMTVKGGCLQPLLLFLHFYPKKERTFPYAFKMSTFSGQTVSSTLEDVQATLHFTSPTLRIGTELQYSVFKVLLSKRKKIYTVEHRFLFLRSFSCS